MNDDYPNTQTTKQKNAMNKLIVAVAAAMALLPSCSDEITGFEDEAETTDNAVEGINPRGQAGDAHNIRKDAFGGSR